MKSPYIIAICGLKNSGKTTFIEKMLPLLQNQGIKTAVIKHAGHHFDADVPGTDTCRFLEAGAEGTLVFDTEKYMLTVRQNIFDMKLQSIFPDADLILLEGFKNSSYDKLEIVRKGIAESNVCSGKELKGIISDFKPSLNVDVPVFSLNEPIHAVNYIVKLMNYDTNKADRGVWKG